MARINSKQKGARGEREFAALLTDYGYESKRGQQFKGGEDSPDVITELPVHFEVKRTERLLLYEAMAQAVRDSNGGKMPVVAHRRSHGEWVAVLRMSDLLDLLADRHPPRRVRRITRKRQG